MKTRIYVLWYAVAIAMGALNSCGTIEQKGPPTQAVGQARVYSPPLCNL